MVMQESLSDTYNDIKDLDRQIEDLIENDDDLQDDVDQADDFSARIRKRLAQLRNFLEQQQEETITNILTYCMKTGIKLPKLVLKTFDGDA